MSTIGPASLNNAAKSARVGEFLWRGRVMPVGLVRKGADYGPSRDCLHDLR